MGHDVASRPEAVRRNLGFNSATTALYPRLTARETLEFFARINGVPGERVRERVEDSIDRFGIARVRRRARRQAVPGHEAEGLDRAHGGRTIRRC